MKVRHLPEVLRRYPGFVLRNGPRMLAHTFRGTTWRSVARAGERAPGLPRYKARRAAERDYVPESAIPPAVNRSPLAATP